ncbi:MAG: hypothetical protein ACK54T_00970, partial [bacterium]
GSPLPSIEWPLRGFLIRAPPAATIFLGASGETGNGGVGAVRNDGLAVVSHAEACRLGSRQS